MASPAPIDTFLWRRIDTCPADEKIWLEVTNAAGDIYALPFACTRQGDEFYTEVGARLQVTPVRWKPYFPRNLGLNPRYRRQSGRPDTVGRTRSAPVVED